MTITDKQVKECEAMLATLKFAPTFFMGIPLERFSREALLQITARSMHAVKEAERDAEHERKFWMELRGEIK